MTAAGGRWAQVIGGAAVVCAVSVGLGVTPHAQTPSTVWAGVYTDDQAKRGETASNKLCTSCHGPDLTGGEAGPALVGLEFIGNWNALSLGDLVDRVQATMPADAPGSMTQQQTSDVAAYMLKLNKFPAGQAELTIDQGALKAIMIESQAPAK